MSLQRLCEPFSLENVFGFVSMNQFVIFYEKKVGLHFVIMHVNLRHDYIIVELEIELDRNLHHS